MRAAGLNPVLSAQGSGASTPSGSMATADFGDLGYSSAVEALNKSAVNENLREQNKQISANTDLQRVEAQTLAANSAADVRLKNENARRVALENEALEVLPPALRGSNTDIYSKGANIATPVAKKAWSGFRAFLKGAKKGAPAGVSKARAAAMQRKVDRLNSTPNIRIRRSK